MTRLAQAAAEDPLVALGWVALTAAVGSVVGNAAWALVRYAALAAWKR